MHHAQTHWQPERNAQAHDAYAWSGRLAHLAKKQQWFHYIAEIIRELRSLGYCVFICVCFQCKFVFRIKYQGIHMSFLPDSVKKSLSLVVHWNCLAGRHFPLQTPDMCVYVSVCVWPPEVNIQFYFIRGKLVNSTNMASVVTLFPPVWLRKSQLMVTEVTVRWIADYVITRSTWLITHWHTDKDVTALCTGVLVRIWDQVLL